MFKNFRVLFSLRLGVWRSNEPSRFNLLLIVWVIDYDVGDRRRKYGETGRERQADKNRERLDEEGRANV